VASAVVSKDERRLRRSSTMAGVGDGVVAVALPLLAANVTRDPLAIAAVVAAQHLPWVVVHAGWRFVNADRRGGVAAFRIDIAADETPGEPVLLAADGDNSSLTPTADALFVLRSSY